MAKRKSGSSKKTLAKSGAIGKKYLKKLTAAVGIFAAGSVVGAEVDFSSLSPYFELAVPISTEASVSDSSTSSTNETTADIDVNDTTVSNTKTDDTAYTNDTVVETEKIVYEVSDTPEITYEPSYSEPDSSLDTGEAVVPSTEPTLDTDPNTDYETIFNEIAGGNSDNVAEKDNDLTYKSDDWMEAIFVPSDVSGDTDNSGTSGGSAEVTGANDSSMTAELAGMLENVAVFWTRSGEKIHLDPNCRSVGDVHYAGTLEEAQSVRTGGWCKQCAEHLAGTDNATFYIKGNVLATYESLMSSYTYEDYINKR